MKSKSKNFGFIKLTYKSMTLGTVYIVALLIGIFIFNKQATTHSTYSTNMYQPTIDSNKKGFHGYNPENDWFDLTLPKECVIGPEKIITCTTPTFKVTITPQAGGRDAVVKEKEQINLNGRSWERVILNDPEFSATYEFDVNANTYLIGAKYEPDMNQAQAYFEKILSTFRFIN